jgi:hypothetical protein
MRYPSRLLTQCYGVKFAMGSQFSLGHEAMEISRQSHPCLVNFRRAAAQRSFGMTFYLTDCMEHSLNRPRSSRRLELTRRKNRSARGVCDVVQVDSKNAVS